MPRAMLEALRAFVAAALARIDAALGGRVDVLPARVDVTPPAVAVAVDSPLDLEVRCAAPDYTVRPGSVSVAADDAGFLRPGAVRVLAL